ncbi:uncharacterized protein LOC144650100 [Oculina patagonica]
MGDLDNYKRDAKSSGSKPKRKVVSRHSCKQEASVFDPGSFITLSDKKLEKMTIKELNEYTRAIPKHQAQMLKRRRRILKNRTYALKCRLKSNQKRVKMADENVSLEKELSATKKELTTILNERDYYKSKYAQLCSRVLETASTATRASKLAN